MNFAIDLSTKKIRRTRGNKIVLYWGAPVLDVVGAYVDTCSSLRRSALPLSVTVTVLLYLLSHQTKKETYTNSNSSYVSRDQSVCFTCLVAYLHIQRK